MEGGVAGPPGALAQEKGSQGVEPAIIHHLVAVGYPALENSLKADSVRMRSCNIFGKWIGNTLSTNASGDLGRFMILTQSDL